LLQEQSPAHAFEMRHIISHQLHLGLGAGGGDGGGGGGAGAGAGAGSGVDGGESRPSRSVPSKPAHRSSVKLVRVPSHLQVQSTCASKRFAGR
jgi:hypothetical protein